MQNEQAGKSPQSIADWYPASVYQTAVSALRAGISFLPIGVDGSKRPVVKWKSYQHRRPTLSEARRWFYGTNHGIAFITGQVSGGLEVLDFDSLAIYEDFVERIQSQGLAALLERIVQGYHEQTPKGIHLLYRCSSIYSSQKVAQRLVAEPQRLQSLIETRGEGGYSIGAPSRGRVHPSGRPYRLLQGGLESIQTISSAERTQLFAVAHTFNETPQTEKPAREAHQSNKSFQRESGARRPGDIFNERATWAEILEPHGWVWEKRLGREDFWRRPGKEQGLSASTNYEDTDLLYVFSTSTPFEPLKGIDKFGAYTILEHQGNFSAAAKDLIALGYVDEVTNPRIPPQQ